MTIECHTVGAPGNQAILSNPVPRLPHFCSIEHLRFEALGKPILLHLPTQVPGKSHLQNWLQLTRLKSELRTLSTFPRGKRDTDFCYYFYTMAFVLSTLGVNRSSSRNAVCHHLLRKTAWTPIPQRTLRVVSQPPHGVISNSHNPRNSISALRAPTAGPTVLTILSTIVGVCVLIGSVLYKIPQVVRVIRRRSAAGISVLMYALETIGTTFSAVYFARRAIPFSTYGESVFIMGQNAVIITLIVFYENLPRLPAALCAMLYILSLFLLYSQFIPMRVLMILQVCSIPILNLARIPQILLNWRRKGTGELSPITLGLQLLGNVARIFTTIAQVKDPLMFIGICVATCFNGTLFSQWLYYSRRTRRLANHVPNS